MASVPGVLDFLVPYILFNVQSATLSHPFWTSAYLSSASPSNPSCLPHQSYSPLVHREKGSEEAHASSLPFSYGPEGSRTPVRKPIPCSSTIIVDCLTFPPVHENQHPCTFSSFMIRPASQSFDTVVSYMFEAWVLKCRCFKSDCCN